MPGSTRTVLLPLVGLTLSFMWFFFPPLICRASGFFAKFGVLYINILLCKKYRLSQSCDLLQKKHHVPDAMHYIATPLHQNPWDDFIKISPLESGRTGMISLRKCMYVCLLFLWSVKPVVKNQTVNYFTTPLIFYDPSVGWWSTALNHLIAFIIKTSSTSTR